MKKGRCIVCFSKQWRWGDERSSAHVTYIVGTTWRLCWLPAPNLRDDEQNYLLQDYTVIVFSWKKCLCIISFSKLWCWGDERSCDKRHDRAACPHRTKSRRPLSLFPFSSYRKISFLNFNIYGRSAPADWFPPFLYGKGDVMSPLFIRDWREIIGDWEKIKGKGRWKINLLE